jgi:hypothetical protein
VDLNLKTTLASHVMRVSGGYVSTAFAKVEASAFSLRRG